MSFDIAKYPTLALVDSTQELRLLPKRACQSFATNCAAICSTA
jgi:hypothetical protein